mmetsp:Transcript_36646/g.67816  ORF Transcript_36646/g.67816 Transcript_36646/m.67816 type:complete len:230 (+) Transcript_36646:447-1136(+)
MGTVQDVHRGDRGEIGQVPRVHQFLRRHAVLRAPLPDGPVRLARGEDGRHHHAPESGRPRLVDVPLPDSGVLPLHSPPRSLQDDRRRDDRRLVRRQPRSRPTDGGTERHREDRVRGHMHHAAPEPPDAQPHDDSVGKSRGHRHVGPGEARRGPPQPTHQHRRGGHHGGAAHVPGHTGTGLSVAGGGDRRRGRRRRRRLGSDGEGGGAEDVRSPPRERLAEEQPLRQGRP